MRTIWWLRFAPRANLVRSNHNSGSTKCVRLHAERREDPLMMSGNDPGDAGSTFVASALDASRWLVAAVATFDSASAALASASAAADTLGAPARQRAIVLIAAQAGSTELTAQHLGRFSAAVAKRVEKQPQPFR